IEVSLRMVDGARQVRALLHEEVVHEEVRPRVQLQGLLFRWLARGESRQEQQEGNKDRWFHGFPLETRPTKPIISGGLALRGYPESLVVARFQRAVLRFARFSRHSAR